MLPADDQVSVCDKNHLRSFLNDCNLNVIFRGSDPSQWDRVIEGLYYIPLCYSGDEIDYQISYWAGSGVSIKDMSMIIIHDNQPCGIWPLSISGVSQNLKIGSNGDFLMPPLFFPGLAQKTVKAIIERCLNFIECLARYFNLINWSSAESFIGLSEISDWHDRSLRRYSELTIKHELFSDLSKNLSDIKSGIRKSYKALITSGSKLWDVHVLDCHGSGHWEEYRLLHQQVAGRVTRSEDSWARQYRAIQEQKAFLVYLRDATGRMVGGGLFRFTRDEGVYAVGAYDRNLFDKPLGHVVQYRAIEELKKRGVRWYKLGSRPYPSDDPVPSPKELSIAEFKHGFASQIFPRYIIRHRLNSF